MILSAIDKDRRARVGGGFTLVELLVVILILAILIGLLLPAINGALRTARKAAVSSEINQIASALASFKTKYGDYPPSRIWVAENGDYGSAPLTAIAPGDITYAQLAQRTASILRKFWPRLVLNTVQGQGAVFPPGSATWYDFNGDGFLGISSTHLHPGSSDGYILQGHQCLTFFLGGMPVVNSTGSYGVSGFSKDPTNPFTSLISAFGTNRSSPLFEFVPGRLFADPNDAYQSGVPGYYDSLGGVPGGASGLNFYAYFSAYGNGNYDPNDVNLNLPTGELDANNNGPIGLNFQVTFPIPGSAGNVNISSSFAPNPYTSSLSHAGAATPTVTYLNPQSFQIISSGIDGLYGVGGQYVSSSSASATSTNPLPPDPTALIHTTDSTVRQREQDNLTNFKATSLQ
jgi:prepilin-type N-terminal cleavage/methylation domain-containing protein